MNKHTPGPWQVGMAFDNYGTTEIAIEHMTTAGNLIIAVALDGLQGQDANARLIAAAPDLLEALKYCRQKIEYMRAHGEWYSPGKATEMADAAIAKATGEQA
jgi:hypothetical protein